MPITITSRLATRNRTSLQRGFTLIEITIVLMVMGILATVAASAARDEAFVWKASTIAGQMRTITGGVSTMMSSNFENMAAGSAVAGFVDPLHPTIPELRTKGYLANNVNATNIAGTNFKVEIRRVPTGCVAPACDLTALIYTDASFIRKDGNPDTQLAVKVSEIANEKSGTNDAGTAKESAPGTISGPNGTWTATNPNGNVQAVVAMQTGFGAQGFSQFVRQGDTRAITLGNTLDVAGNTTVGGNATVARTLTVGGNTEMRGNATVAGNTTVGGNATVARTLTVGGNTEMRWNATVAGTLTSTNATITNSATVAKLAGNLEVTTTATEGWGCWPNGKIARNAAGLLLSCQSGVWKRNGDADGGSYRLSLGAFNGIWCWKGGCKVNPRTGDYSCPAGYTAIGGITGYGFFYRQWDRMYYVYNCVKNY